MKLWQTIAGTSLTNYTVLKTTCVTSPIYATVGVSSFYGILCPR